MTSKDQLLNQLDSLIAQGNALLKSYRYGDMGVIQSDLPETDFRAFSTASFAAISRIAGPSSEFFKMLPTLTTNDQLNIPGYANTKIPSIVGSLVALRGAVNDGYLISLESKLRANIHSDFLEQARSLVEAAYHVAAMVLIGGVLEDHLCRMCVGRSLTWKGNGSISKYNELLHGQAYDKAVWRRIQSIGDSRNDAAHGNGSKVQTADVEEACKFVERFIVDYPA